MVMVVLLLTVVIMINNGVAVNVGCGVDADHNGICFV